VTLERAHGFVFVELYVPDPAYYVRIFHGALGFEVVRDEGDFVELRSSRGLLLLNRFDDPDPGHPFEHYRQGRCGLGVEIGIFCEDLEASWRRARQVEGCEVTEIVRQEWGMTDFRILTPHGYYLRVTTPG
jgi:catechol 2,3-dioxygenase-like lactoylglutathione lyase family enzyme